MLKSTAERKRKRGPSRTFGSQLPQRKSYIYGCYGNRRPKSPLFGCAPPLPSPPLISGLMKGSSCVDVVMLVSAPQTPPQNGPTRWLWTIYGLVLFVITKEIFRVSISDFISPFFTIVFAENCNILYKFGKNSWFASGFFFVCS